MTSDYNWIKKTLMKHPRGLSPKDLDRISSDERKIKQRTWWERPPGRDKIYQILDDYDGKDWDYTRAVGAGNRSIVKIKKIDTASRIGSVAKDILIIQEIKSLEELFNKRTEKFSLSEIIKLHKVKESIVKYPVMTIYNLHNKKKEMQLQFTRSLEISKKEIKKIRKIETEQLKINPKFKETYEYLDEIENSNLLEHEIYGQGSKYKSFLSPRNSIRAIHKVNVKK